MSINSDIKTGVRELVGDQRIYSVACLVDNINTTDMTCDCEPLDGSADFLGVKIMPQAGNGWTLIPKDQSTVYVTQLNSATGFLSGVSEIDKVIIYIDASNKLEIDSSGFVFNGGTLDGMVKVNSLVTKLNNLENAFNTHVTAYNLHVHAGVTVGAGATGITTPDAQTLTPTVKANLENTKIKQ